MGRWPRAAVVLATALLAGCEAAAVLTHDVDTEATAAPPGVYTLSPRHSDLLFSVSHLGYSRYYARFDRVEAELTFDPADPGNSRVDATIEVASLSTGDGEIDRLLKSDSFFDAARHPQIRFTSRRVTVTGPITGLIDGDLIIGEQTGRVTLEVTFNGGAPSPLEPFYVLGFSATGRFSRGAFGLTDWLPAIGDEVEILIEAEFLQPR